MSKSWFLVTNQCRANSDTLADPRPPHSTSRLAPSQDTDIYKGKGLELLLLPGRWSEVGSWLPLDVHTTFRQFWDAPFSHFSISETGMCLIINWRWFIESLVASFFLHLVIHKINASLPSNGVLNSIKHSNAFLPERWRHMPHIIYPQNFGYQNFG